MELLEQEEVAAGIAAANEKGEEERASEWPRRTAESIPPRLSSAGRRWGHGHVLQPLVSPGVPRSAAGREPNQRRHPPRDAGQNAGGADGAGGAAARRAPPRCPPVPAPAGPAAAPAPKGEGSVSRSFPHDFGGSGMG